MKPILEYFPQGRVPRQSQIEVLTAIERAVREGYSHILLESPVGSGKSLVAITLSNYFGESHILTPRKSLQDQYLEDFRDLGDVAVMKGRGAYPCTTIYDDLEWGKVIRKITRKESLVLLPGEDSCSEAACVGNKTYYKECLGFDSISQTFARECPYQAAVAVAQKSSKIIHNLHSFIFQTSFANYFEQRNLLAIDECHEVEHIVRDFAMRGISIPQLIDPALETFLTFKRLTDWADWLGNKAYLFSDTHVDKFGVTDREKFETGVDSLRDYDESFGEEFVVDVVPDRFLGKTKFSFIPLQIGRVVNRLLLGFGQKRLLMSGTIYDKSVFCRTNGLPEEDTCFIRIGSSFPKSNRPIHLKKDYLVDLSHRSWDQNFGKMIDNLRKVFSIFSGVKGLIHTPSYMASEQIWEALKDTGRVVSHTRDSLPSVLSRFYNTKDNSVLLSPTCQQGVDFKDDRSRFQVILRVPYLNTSDSFVSRQVKDNFPWYNYQALVTFGQQIGRVVRSEEDWGHTILMDERFIPFLHRNRNILPKWVKESIQR